MTASAICPAHGWWALYSDAERPGLFELGMDAQRVVFWESDDDVRFGLVDNGVGVLVPAELLYGDDAVSLCGFVFDPVAYDDPRSEAPATTNGTSALELDRDAALTGEHGIEDLAEKVRRSQLPSPGKRRRIREAAQVSHRAAGDALGISAMTFMRWEKGTSTPTLDQSVRYRDFLDRLEEAVAV